MRVTFVSYDDTPPEGGQGVELEGMRRAVAGQGVAVQTVSGRGDHEIFFPRRTGRRPLDFSWHINRHPSTIDATSPDVIHALGGPGGVLITRKLDTPLVYTANHTYRQAHPGWSLRRPLGTMEIRGYRRAQRVLAISQSTADALVAAGLGAQSVEVLAPGVHIPEDIDFSKRESNLVLFVGRLEENKGVFDMLTVVEAVWRRMPSLRALVVGSGRLEDAIRNAVAERHLPVELLGRVDDDTLHSLYERAGVVLMPSRYEGLGLVAAEAIARGAPVAGYDVEGLRDIVTPSGGGHLVIHGSLLGLAEVTHDCLTHYDVTRAEAARGWLREHHSWNAVGARLVEIYESL